MNDEWGTPEDKLMLRRHACGIDTNFLADARAVRPYQEDGNMVGARTKVKMGIPGFLGGVFRGRWGGSGGLCRGRSRKGGGL